MPQTPLVIDLSHHNVIPKSLHDTHAAGIAGIIHKATENTKHVDEKAKARFALTRDAGMLWGIYHFLRPKNIRAQADFFLSQTSLIDKDTLLVCDFEVPNISLDEVLAFLERVESQSGQKPVLYTGNALKDLGGASKHPELTNYRLWLAHYTNRSYPILPQGYRHAGWWLWQYTDQGSVQGIDGFVDFNAYDGTASDLKNDWVIKTSAAANITNQESATDISATSSEPTDNKSSNQTPPPITTSVEQTKTQAVTSSGEASTASETKVTAEIPKGDPPETPPVQVSRGKWFSYIVSGLGGSASVVTAVWGWMGSNLNAVGIGMICLTLIILALMFRKAILDAIRMQAAADPDKRNVK